MNRIVIKIGSNILADVAGGLNHKRIDAIAKDVAEVCNDGYEVVIVSSGAVAAGMRKLGLKAKPKEIRLKQAAAAAGQSSLMWAYEKSFEEFGKKVAQVLLTREDLSERVRYLNAKNTLITLLSYGIIPIVNENDTVATDEIKFGDNDQLAALVSGLIDAERLIILSDVEGLYTADPRTNPDAAIIPFVDEISPEFEAMAGGAGSVVGTGGMYSKILAAKKAISYRVTVNIISGKKKGIIPLLLTGAQCGTEFRPRTKKISSRKGWIAYALRPKGTLFVDDGAVNALMRAGKSLLPSGIVKVEGVFDIGDAVYCTDSHGTRIAKGIVNYSSSDIEKIKGRKTSEIDLQLGYKYSDEVIHRDNLVVLS
ncbi:MAG: glutamate 5-kinase [Nitrospirota bacterium]